jgi:hypothetical protein
MSNTTPPPPPDFPPPPPGPPAPKKSRTNAVIIGSAAAVIAAVVATGVIVVQSTGDDSKAVTATSSAPDRDAVTTAAEEPAPEPTYSELDVDSFTIKLRTKTRQCFGSAGCSMTVEPDLTYLGDTEDIDPDTVYEITYEIHGDESGPVIETAELTDRTNLSYTPSVISTASAGTKVTVEITDITAQGG